MHYGVEEMFFILRGTPTVRTPDGEEQLSPGDVVYFPEGPDGLHDFSNPTDEPVVLTWMPAASVYFHDPDGHQLEFICMLPDPPQPELGVVTWSRWLRRHELVAAPI